MSNPYPRVGVWGCQWPGTLGSSEICHFQWGADGGPVNATIVPPVDSAKGQPHRDVDPNRLGRSAGARCHTHNRRRPQNLHGPDDLPVGGLWSATATITM